MRQLVAILVVLALLTPAVGRAQGDETLADIRQELSVLYVELQKLKRELSTTGSSGEITVGGSILDRVTAIESELQRLTAKTEELEFRIDRVVRDGSNQVGDLEFRLCELESGCDVGALGQGTTLGGVAPATGGGAASGSDSLNEAGGDPQLAIGEQADFDTATAAFERGEFAAAADQFAVFQQNYPGGPLTMKARLMEGRALEQQGEMTRAARIYLDAFSAGPEGPQAPEALFRLGNALGRLGQTEEACVTLGEVEARFPQAGAVADAQEAMQRLGCQ